MTKRTISVIHPTVSRKADQATGAGAGKRFAFHSRDLAGAIPLAEASVTKRCEDWPAISGLKAWAMAQRLAEQLRALPAAASHDRAEQARAA